MSFTPKRRTGFAKDRLPSPASYHRFSPQGGRWRSVRCPFHEDTHPSLSINVDSGGFRCHACGAKGGDVLAFHMQKHGLDFKAAARELGAWT